MVRLAVGDDERFQVCDCELTRTAPSYTIDTVKEIAVIYNQNLAEFFNKLTPQERVFIYYLFRASLPGNIIACDQSHRDAPKIKELLEYVIEHQEKLKDSDFTFDIDKFLNDVQIYLTYLWTNHSQYFMREHADEKRTPQRLGLEVLTQEHLISALEQLGYPGEIGRASCRESV